MVLVGRNTFVKKRSYLWCHISTNKKNWLQILQFFALGSKISILPPCCVQTHAKVSRFNSRTARYYVIKIKFVDISYHTDTVDTNYVEISSRRPAANTPYSLPSIFVMKIEFALAFLAHNNTAVVQYDLFVVCLLVRQVK